MRVNMNEEANKSWLCWKNEKKYKKKL